MRDVNVLVTIAHQDDLGRRVDNGAVNELTCARSLGPYLQHPPEPKLAFGGTAPSKAVTGIRELCGTA